MDGREFVNMSPLGRSGPSLEAGCVSSGSTGGRFVPSTGPLAPFYTAKYFPTPLGLHTQPGFPHFGRSVYIPMTHLYPTSGGSPLLAPMGSRSFIEPENDGVCFAGQQSIYHPPTSTNEIQSSHLHENDLECHSYKNSKEASKDSRDKFCKNELLVGSCLLGTSKKRRLIAEETLSGDLVDRDMETKVEREKKKSGLHRVLKIGEHHSPFISELVPNRWSGNNESQCKHPLQNSLLSNCNHGDSFVKSISSEEERCVKDQSRHDENIRPMCYTNSIQSKQSESILTTATNLGVPCNCPSSQSSNFLCKLASPSTLPTQPLHSSIYNINPQAKKTSSELRVLAPGSVPTVEASDEQNDNIQVCSQTRDFKDKVRNSEEMVEFPLPHITQEFLTNDLTSVESFRGQGSVICCNNSLNCQDVSDSFLNTPGHTSLEKRTFFPSTVPTPCRQGDRTKETCQVFGLKDSHQHTRHSFVKVPEQKVKQLEIGDCNTSQMAVLVTQHSQVSQGKEEAKKLCAESKTLGPSKTNSETPHLSVHCERSAMRSLIKYSGNFAKEAVAWQSSGKKSPFGGLGNMKLNESQLKAVKVQTMCQQEVKKDPDRHESAMSLTKDIMGFQGDLEVRNPPVGIAVAVARQKEYNGSKVIPSKVGHVREDCVDDRIRHCNERLERFDREHAKLLRDLKDLPDVSQMHPARSATIGLSSNLMVTGGTALSASEPWTTDSTSHLVTHPWLPSGVMPCMWHADNPYGLAHPTLHQGMNLAIPTGASASFAPAYSFARDTQNGQIVVIPAEHISHFEILDRTSSLWPSMYSSTRSSLQHAHQLQIFSQQHLMRQHELYMLLQQQAAHSVDLHMSAQLDALESQRSDQKDALDLHRNTHTQLQKTSQLEVKELHRRAPLNSQEYPRNEKFTDRIKLGEEKVVAQTSETTKKSSLCSTGTLQRNVISPPVSASCRNVFSPSSLPIKSFQMSNKMEEPPDIHLSKFPSLCFTPPTTIMSTKMEVHEESIKDTDMKQDVSSPLKDPTHGYSFKSFSPSVQQCISYITQQTDVVKLPHLSANCIETSLNLNPTHVLENSETGKTLSDTVKFEDVTSVLCRERLEDQEGVCADSMECQNILFQEIDFPITTEIEHKTLIESLPSCISEVNLSNGKGTPLTQTDFLDTFSHAENAEVNLMALPQNVEQSHRTNEITDLHSLPVKEFTDGDIGDMAPGAFSGKGKDVFCELPNINSAHIKTEDPLAGMNALVAATEMPQACSLMPKTTVILAPDICLDHSLFQDIVLLSEIAQIQLEKRKHDLQSCHVKPSLESLFAASTQMLMEVLSSPAVDGLKPESIRLPRELTLNKKYSWMRKNPRFSVASVIEDMDSVELDCRERLAELQRRYKAKQRELAKLQRRSDSEEKPDEILKNLTRRGPGRPKKRKYGINHLCHTQERMKQSNTQKLSKCVLISESSRTGDFLQRTLLNISDMDEVEIGALNLKSSIHNFVEQGKEEGYMYEFTDHSGRKQSDARNLKTLLGSEFKQMQSIHLSRIVSREDTEEDDHFIRNEWPSQPKSIQYSMCNMLSRKMKTLGYSQSPESISSCYRTVKSKQSVSRNKKFCLLLQDPDAGSSFSDSTEDSFDQDYSSEEEEDYVGNDIEQFSGPDIEDSGLGLLARFAASLQPSPIISPPLSKIQLKHKQMSDEGRQGLIGTEFEDTDSEIKVKIKAKSSVDITFSNAKKLDNSTIAATSIEAECIPNCSAKGKIMDKAQKCKKFKSAKDRGQEFAVELSDDDLWSRRRSERIFLHGAISSPSVLPDVSTSATSVSKTIRCSKVASPKKGKEQKDNFKKKRTKEPLSSCLSSSDMGNSLPKNHLNVITSVSCSRRNKLKLKSKNLKEENQSKCGAVSKLMESMAAEEDFEPSQDSSFSEDENVPFFLQTERPVTPAPRSCIIDKEELKDGLQVLIPMDDKLLYAGHVQTVHSPDIYRVIVEGERGNRPHIYCQEQLLQEAIIDVKPPSVRFLLEGTRIAAYWSQQYRCLYPGTIVRGNADQEKDTDLVTVEFDDGDTGRIPLSHIRMLPPDYKIQCAEPSPALLVPSAKRKIRKSSQEKNDVKEGSIMSSEEMMFNRRPRGRKPCIKQISEESRIQENADEDTSQATKIKEENQLNLIYPNIKTNRESLRLPPKISTAPNVGKYIKVKKTFYLGSLFRNMVSGGLYCESTGNGFNQSVLKDKIKAKKRPNLEEQKDFVPVNKSYRKREAQLLVKLDHEGVMSPKSKKTKETMMRLEDSNNMMRNDHKTMISGCYSNVNTSKPKEKFSDTKHRAAEQDFGSEAFDHAANNSKIMSDQKIGSQKNEGQLKNSNSSSESEEDDERKKRQDTLQHSSSSSKSSTSKSSTSTSSRSLSSSSSSSTSSSSTSSSSSSSLTDDASSSSEDDAANAASILPDTQKHHCKCMRPDSTSKTTIYIRQQKQEQQRAIRCKPKKREGIHLPTTKELAKRQRLPSVENRPKIAAFLPARQLWKWSGKPTQRRGMKGKARKLFYKAIVRGKEIIRIGDCAVFLSAGRPNLPYIGCIQSMWESWGNNMVVRVKWFYHPEETSPGKKLNDCKGNQQLGKSNTSCSQISIHRKDFMERALYQSSHIDENDVQTVSHKCLVVALEQYEQMLRTKKYHDSEDLYYLAGTYEPTTGMIFNTDGVPVIC
ncbi:trinucleotide repeat-containing gene 18 protein isoform X2 [Mixophyes fleayi]|uniref:trinucleotide repeat-containing gene 18 protein isoform X2 n=1 Tax=Mixophyes fleayi TaxID=3061075 RepID=UPI003F4DFE6A